MISFEHVENVTCIPCVMPFIVSQFMPHKLEDRPAPAPVNSKNIGFIS